MNSLMLRKYRNVLKATELVMIFKGICKIVFLYSGDENLFSLC